MLSTTILSSEACSATAAMAGAAAAIAAQQSNNNENAAAASESTQCGMALLAPEKVYVGFIPFYIQGNNQLMHTPAGGVPMFGTRPDAESLQDFIRKEFADYKVVCIQLNFYTRNAMVMYSRNQ